MKKYLKDPMWWVCVTFIICIGIGFGVYYSWLAPGIAWPAFALLFYFGRKIQ